MYTITIVLNLDNLLVNTIEEGYRKLFYKKLNYIISRLSSIYKSLPISTSRSYRVSTFRNIRIVTLRVVKRSILRLILYSELI